MNLSKYQTIEEFNFTFLSKYLLGHFENPKKPEGSKAGKAERSCPRFEVDPEYFEYGPGYDSAVKSGTKKKFNLLTII